MKRMINAIRRELSGAFNTATSAMYYSVEKCEGILNESIHHIPNNEEKILHLQIEVDRREKEIKFFNMTMVKFLIHMPIFLVFAFLLCYTSIIEPFGIKSMVITAISIIGLVIDLLLYRKVSYKEYYRLKENLIQAKENIIATLKSKGTVKGSLPL